MGVFEVSESRAFHLTGTFSMVRGAVATVRQSLLSLFCHLEITATLHPDSKCDPDLDHHKSPFSYLWRVHTVLIRVSQSSFSVALPLADARIQDSILRPLSRSTLILQGVIYSG